MEVKCETEDCKRLAKVRVIKSDLVRIHNKSSIGRDVNLQYKEIIKERFLCTSCAINTSYTIVEWIVDKIPHEQLFGVDGLSIKYADSVGMRYWAMSHERDLRWKEQLHCQNCGHKLLHENRLYSDDSGYDSPDRWVNVHKIVHCKNCGFFDYKMRHAQIAFSHKKENAGEYHGWKTPDSDPDYKQWQKTLKELEEKDDETIDT